MKDLISREALALDVRRNLMPNVDADGTVSVEDAERYFLSRIAQAPAVDAVEVVRCIECEEFEPNEIVAPQTGTCWHCEMVRDFDSFCSYGKRRRDGE